MEFTAQGCRPDSCLRPRVTPVTRRTQKTAAASAAKPRPTLGGGHFGIVTAGILAESALRKLKLRGWRCPSLGLLTNWHLFFKVTSFLPEGERCPQLDSHATAPRPPPASVSQGQACALEGIHRETSRLESRSFYVASASGSIQLPRHHHAPPWLSWYFFLFFF